MRTNSRNSIPASTLGIVRLRRYAASWNVAIADRVIETPSSLIAFGTRGHDDVVLKIVKHEGDEWRAGEVIRASDGHGMVRALEVDDGAMLLERVVPGTSLAEMVPTNDDGATTIIADVMRRFSPREAPTGTPTVEDWGRAFDRYRASGDRQIPTHLVTDAHALYAELSASQTNRRLLHGDLQHSNILFDHRRGWIAIDPKGVIGEAEFEVGPLLRNPIQMPHLFNRPEIVEHRLHVVCADAGLRYERAIRWAFALAVLSVIWGVEDDGVVHDDNPALTLAGALRPAIERASL
jgi:streptomycin 6-kinase